MNEDKQKVPAPTNSNGIGLQSTLKRLLRPQVLLFLIALVYSISEFISAMQEKGNPFVFSQWMFVRDLMLGPLLLLITSGLILIHRLTPTVVAIAMAGYLIYVTAYRGLMSVPNSHGVPIFSLDALKIWFKATPNDLILQAAFATVALILATIQLVRLQQSRRQRSSY